MARTEADCDIGRARILVAALVENAMRDAAIMKRAGLWEDDPVEVRTVGEAKRRTLSMSAKNVLDVDRYFWGGDGESILLKLAAELIPLRVTRAQFIDGINRLADGHVDKRYAG